MCQQGEETVYFIIRRGINPGKQVLHYPARQSRRSADGKAIGDCLVFEAGQVLGRKCSHAIRLRVQGAWQGIASVRQRNNGHYPQMLILTQMLLPPDLRQHRREGRQSGDDLHRPELIVAAAVPAVSLRPLRDRRKIPEFSSSTK